LLYEELDLEGAEYDELLLPWVEELEGLVVVVPLFTLVLLYEGLVLTLGFV
jgi:hypothetical protein